MQEFRNRTLGLSGMRIFQTLHLRNLAKDGVFHPSSAQKKNLGEFRPVPRGAGGWVSSEGPPTALAFQRVVSMAWDSRPESSPKYYGPLPKERGNFASACASLPRPTRFFGRLRSSLSGTADRDPLTNLSGAGVLSPSGYCPNHASTSESIPDSIKKSIAN